MESKSKLVLPNIELVASKVHESWMAAKTANGITSRKSETDEELMVPYEQLSEEAKGTNRNLVNTVYQAIEECVPEVEEEKAQVSL